MEADAEAIRAAVLLDEIMQAAPEHSTARIVVVRPPPEQAHARSARSAAAARTWTCKAGCCERAVWPAHKCCVCASVPTLVKAVDPATFFADQDLYVTTVLSPSLNVKHLYSIQCQQVLWSASKPFAPTPLCRACLEPRQVQRLACISSLQSAVCAAVYMARSPLCTPPCSSQRRLATSGLGRRRRR